MDKIPKIIRHISSKLMQISQHDAWLFPELRNNGAALYTLFTVGKICRQNVSFELEKASVFPPSNHSPALFLKVSLLSCIHLTFFHLTSSLPSLPPFQRLVISVILPCLASLALCVCVCVSVTIEVCFNRLHLFTSSAVLCTSMEDFQALSWMMCWPTPLHPAWRLLTPSRVLQLVLEFAAIGSAVDVCPGSQNHRSRLFLLLFALNPLVCYPWALTPTIYVLHSKYFDCRVSINFWKGLLSKGHFAIY